MQCVNCSFENMPGMSTCTRCGSVLQLGDICVQPPRASRHRAATRVQRVLHPLRARVARLHLSRRQLTWLLPEPVSLPALLWSIIPGLGHLKIRRPRLGWCILSAWLFLMLLAVLSLGTAWHSFFWNGMVATHLVAIVSLFAASLSYERLLVRALFGLVIFVGLHLVLYQPAAWAGSHVCVLLPVPRIGANNTVRKGDILLYQGSWMRPDSFRHGDLVAYRIEAWQQDGYYVQAGLGLDRIVATPGDHVRVTDGVLYVNGAPLPPDRGTLGALPELNDFEAEVGSGEYLILPTCLDVRLGGEQARNRGIYQRLIGSVSLVRHEDVLGRIWFRLRPLKRFGPVR